MHRTRSCPAALFDLHGVFAALVRSTALPRRHGVTSPASIISGDGYVVVKVQWKLFPSSCPHGTINLTQNTS